MSENTMFESDDWRDSKNDLVQREESHDTLTTEVQHPKSTEQLKMSTLPKRLWSTELINSEDLDNGRPWRPTIMRAGPISGIFGMLLAMASIVASLGILAGSDGADTKTWIGEPSIYLAIFTAIANLSMRYACVQGIAIAWWSRAISGSTVSRLHWDWKAGTSVFGAIISGPKMGLIGLACICSTLVVIDGPLLQRATTVKSVPWDTSVTLNVNIAQELPHNYEDGWWVWDGRIGWSDAFNRTAPSPNGTIATKMYPTWRQRMETRLWSHSWYADRPIPSRFVRGCDGTCKATIRAPALSATKCRSSRIPINLNNTRPFPYNAPPLNVDLFVIGIEFVPGDSDIPERIDLVTAYNDNYDCAGTLKMTACDLESAVGDYDVLISGDDVTINGLPRIVGLANNTQGPYHWSTVMNWYNSSLAGIASVAYEKWEASVGYYGDGSNPPRQRYFSRGQGMENAYTKWSPAGCPVFLDPHNDVMQSLNKLMFVIGLEATTLLTDSQIESRTDPGLPVHTTTTGNVQGEHNVFRSNYYFFAAAAIVEIICIAFVLPTYWGWWKLGRPVSLSPVETAKALDSPLLVDCDSNSSGWDIVRKIGDVRVRYRAASTQCGRKKFALQSPELLDQPQREWKFEV